METEEMYKGLKTMEKTFEILDAKVKYYRSCNCRSCKDMCELVDEIKVIIKDKEGAE